MDADADVVLDDPAHATCLHDVLVHVFNGDLPSVVLTPCDAVSIDREGFAELAAMPEGVPLDPSGRRQVLFSHLPEGWVAVPDAERRVEALFDELEDRPLESAGATWPRPTHLRSSTRCVQGNSGASNEMAPDASASSTRGYKRCSSVFTRAAKRAMSSSSSTGTAAWAMIGPVSIPASTK